LVLQYAPRLLVSFLTERLDSESACARFSAVVLFVDLVESTAMTDEFVQGGGDGAERLASRLNEYFGRVVDIVSAHGGDTVRIDGDAIIAVWQIDPGHERLLESALDAAAAALALQRESHMWQPFGVPLRHRLTLVYGLLSLIVCSECSGRRFFLVDGPPIRQLSNAELRGEPNQVVVSAEMAAIVGRYVLSRTAGCGSTELLQLGCERDTSKPPLPALAEDEAFVSERVRRFVLPVILARLDDGQAAWIAEFRKLTAVYVRLASLHPGLEGVSSRVETAVRIVEAIVNPLRIPITNVLANEKGLVIQVACGVPPYAQENGPALAIQASLRIHHELKAHGFAPALGVTTGDAFCGDVGGAARREYLSTGAVMNYAARLMQHADDEILCDGETARAAAGSADFSDWKRIHVKGRAEGLLVHRVRATGRSSVSVGAGIGAIFGREEELQGVQTRLKGLASGKGGVIAVAAEAGGGKSHLLRHVVREARRCGYLTVVASASLVEQTTAYFALRPLLGQLLRRDDDADEPSLETMRSVAIERLRDERYRTRLALLEDILPLDFPDKDLAPEIKGQARVTGIADLITELLARRAVDAPVVSCVDDLQWIDASSVQILTALVRRVPSMLAVVATRPVDAANPPVASSLLDLARPILHLPRLSHEAIEELVCDRLGVATASASLVDFIHARSEGLPFFAEQLLYALRDRGIFAMPGGAGRVNVGDLSKLAVPGSMRDLVVSRVDLLPTARQLTIKVASVVGREFDAEMLAEVHPLSSSRTSLSEALGRLIEEGFLVSNGSATRPGYAFRHGIIQEVVYELLPYSQRRPLHRTIAQRLEARHAATLSPHYAVLADHWERAADGERAIYFRIEAAGIAAERNAHQDALDHLGRIDALVRRFSTALPAHSLKRCTRIRADSHQELTHFAQANGHYQELASLEQIPVPRARTRLVARVLVEAAAQVLRRAGLVRRLSSGEEGERDSLAAHIYMRFAEHSYFTNDMLGLAHGTLASLNRAERAGAIAEIVNASGGLALGLAAFGRSRWADFYRDRSIQLAATAGSPSAQGFAELLACVQAFHVGDWERMHLHSGRGAVIWRQLGDRYRYQCCLVLDIYRMLATGQIKGADDALAGFGEQAESIDSVQVRAWALAAYAMVDLFLGRPPLLAVGRIAAATAGGELNPAERLLCDGVGASALFEANDYEGALRAAESGLALLEQGSPTMAGALLFSVPSIAEVLLVLSERAGSVGRTRRELMDMSRVACKAAQRFAARNRICRPRASLLRGHLAADLGRRRDRERLYLAALAESERLSLPLEQAMSHFALAELEGPVTARDRHRLQANEILQRFGVVMASWRRLPASAAVKH
jgi:adenylate cyclase